MEIDKMINFLLEMSEEELRDVELSIMITLRQINKNGNLKRNLESVEQKIKQLQECGESDLAVYL